MIEAKPENLIGDRAYDSDPLDAELRKDGIEGQPKQAGHARSPKVKPPHATLARRALLRLDSMAAPDPHSLGVPRPQFPRLCPACLPRYSLQTILRRVLVFIFKSDFLAGGHQPEPEGPI